MTQKSRAALLAQANADITSNNNNEITGAILRAMLIDIIDSALNLTTDGTGTPTLAEVLAEGAVSGANDITMSAGRTVKMSSAGFLAALGIETLTANRTIDLPNADGVVALLSDVIAASVKYHHKKVVSVLAAPPGSPTAGLRHMVASSGTSGVFVGNENKLAEYNGTAWEFTTPNRGDVVYSEAQTDAVYWYGVGAATTSWQLIPLKPTGNHHKAVISVLDTPPGSPSNGDRYLVASTGATGAWAGHEDHITEYNGSVWNFTVPVRGDEVYSLEEQDRVYRFGIGTSATAWQLVPVKSHRASVTGFLGTPPGSPTLGDRYIVSSGTGAWTGHEMEIAEWNGSAWVFELPALGDTVYFTPGPEAFNVYIYNVIGGTPTWMQNNVLPTLLTVLTNGNTAPLIPITVRKVKQGRDVTNHAAAGPLTLAFDSPFQRVNMTDAIDGTGLDWSGLEDGVFYHIEIVNTTGGDLDLLFAADRWVAVSDLWVPAGSLVAGRTVTLFGVRSNVGGDDRFMILSYGDRRYPFAV